MPAQVGSVDGESSAIPLCGDGRDPRNGYCGIFGAPGTPRRAGIPGDVLDLIESILNDRLERLASPDIAATVEVQPGNIRDPADAEACVTATMERFGRVDVLVNNAATNPYMGRTIVRGLSPQL